ncbi:MAG: SIMPL domain-containing protein [Deltaproteobacteria bacterium]|nr:MAG: SIMPL domain-containing protein [Deltaproteobacteria bacterium]
MVCFGALQLRSDKDKTTSLIPVSKNSSETTKTISASASSFVMAKPDVAILSMGIESRGPKLEALLAEVNQKNSLLMQKIKESGVAERDIQSNLSTYPQYSNGGKGIPPKIIGYEVRNKIVLKIRSLSKVGETLDLVISGGINSLDNIQWVIEDDEKYKSQARSAAVRLVMNKIKGMSDAADVKIGDIVSLHEDFSSQEDPSDNITLNKMSASSGLAQGAVSESGMIKVSAQVSVNVEIQ